MSSSRAMRIKKLSPKTILTVLLEGQIDASEYDSLTTEAKIATGVDAGEEDEIHLQAALKGAGQSTDNEIPVPPPQLSEEVKYEDLYSRPFVEPRGYIKSSDTVEETLSCLYDMTTEDDEFLKSYNQKRSSKLSEDDFERIMELFEDTTSEHAPYAAVDNTTVPYEVMASQMAANTSLSKLKTHAQAVYDHWKARRQSDGNKSLHPTLKFETPGQQEHDDMDPYVCFRRREVRQTRKTRARDAMVADKLKKLRRELEDGRQLILLAHQRELMKREMLSTERLLFEHRAKLKEKKVRLGIKEGDEDLYNTKPVKRKATAESQPAAKAAPHTQLRLAVRPEGRPAEQELVQLEDKEKERFEEFLRDIAAKAETHRLWNQKHVDLTEKPLSPTKEVEESSFRPAKAQFLPTPPASASESMELDDEPTEAALVVKAPPTPVYFRGLSPEAEQAMPGYRRRIGRNGRLWIDRRNVGHLASPPSDSDRPQNDRFKYDEDDSDDEQPVYHIDPYDTRPMKFRAGIPLNIMRSYRPGPDGSAAAQITPAARPVLPPPQQGSIVGVGQSQQQVQQSPSQQPSKQQAHVPPPPPPQPQLAS